MACGPNLQTSKVFFLFLTHRNYYFGTENRKAKYKSMFKWPQDKRSRSTECLNLSGEQFFLPSHRRENMTIRVLSRKF